jgi:pSer/pThr/pTyr-binding forkhead associated (FHA) protein
MSEAVTLTLKKGRLKAKQFVDGPARCLVGRAPICDLRVPSDADHWTVSRLHCLLDLDPPEIHIRDLGSRNGTFVNGKLIGQRNPARPIDEAVLLRQPEFPLQLLVPVG